MQDKAVHKALAKKMQRALQYALEREQWSSAQRQRRLERYRVELEQLKQQLTDTQAERDAARRTAAKLAAQCEHAKTEMGELEHSLSVTTSRLQEARNADFRNNAVSSTDTQRRTRRPSQATAAVASVFAVAILFTVVAFHDAQSHVNKVDQGGVSAVNALETLQVVTTEDTSADEKKPAPQSGKGKTRFARVKAASQRQWGPPLLMSQPDAVKPHVVFDPLIKQLQTNLLTLGFDLGEADGFKGLRTRQAIDEFRALYLPDDARQLKLSDLVLVTGNYANLAYNDATRLGMDRGVVAAIRLSSVRTGVDFSYLMKLAATESNFEPAIKSETSSATGIYQFTHDTWLNALKEHGAKYGIADYAAKIGYTVSRSGYRRPVMDDEALYQHLLELRKNPRVAAMMAAESVLESQQRLVGLFDQEPAQTDLYLTHFLGPDGAITFLKALKQNPEAFAVDIFPEAARSNQGIFHPKTCDPRTVDEVYELFGEKFSTRRYDDLAAY